MNNRKIKILMIIIFISFISCGNDYIIIEMIEQNNNLLIDANFIIVTTNDIIDLKYKKKQKIFPKGEILQIDLSSSKEYYTPGYTVGHASYYSIIEKRIVLYFFPIKYGITKINSLDTLLLVEPFDNFNGFYTEHFIYENNKYQVISLKSEIILEQYVENFDFENIIKSGISQYKILVVHILNNWTAY
jgi:hypothetical protein